MTIQTQVKTEPWPTPIDPNTGEPPPGWVPPPGGGDNIVPVYITPPAGGAPGVLPPQPSPGQPPGPQPKPSTTPTQQVQKPPEKKTDTVTITGKFVKPTDQQQKDYHDLTGSFLPDKIFVRGKGDKYEVNTEDIGKIDAADKAIKELPEQAERARKIKSGEIIPAPSKEQAEATIKALTEYKEYKNQVGNFEAEHVKLGDGSYITTADYNSLPENYQKIAKSGGYKALVKAIEADNKAILENNKRVEIQESALVKLAPYKGDGDTYRIDTFLRKNPGQEQVLKDAGFSEKDISETQEFIKRPISTENYVRQYFDDKGWKYDMTRGQYDGESHKDYYKRLQEYDNRLIEASSAYIDEYGNTKFVQSGFGKLGRFIFSPARAIAPDVELKDITPLEWGVGTAQAMLYSVPFVPKPAVKPIFGLSGAVFTADTVLKWPEMSPTERAISVALDTVILAGAVPRVKIKPIINKTTDRIASISGKGPTPKKGTIYEIPAKKLTEGGIVGPWGKYTPVQEVQAVASKTKPIALEAVIAEEDINILRKAKELGLKVKHYGNVQIGQNRYAKNYIIYRDDPNSRLALKRLLDAKNINRSTIDGEIRFHIETGKALGYRPQDIRAYLHNWAQWEPNLKHILTNVYNAIRTRDIYLLRMSAQRLQLQAAFMRNKAVGAALQKRARLMQANPENYITLAEKGPPKGITSDSLKANEDHLELLERGLKRAGSKARKETLKQEIERLKKMIEKERVAIKTAVKTETKPIVDFDIRTFPKGKYPPARVVVEKALVSKSDVVVVKGKPIPVREIKTTSIAAVAKKYGVPESAVKRELKRVPKPVPVIKVNTKPALKTTTHTKTDTKRKEKTRTKPVAKPEPESQVQPLRASRPDTKVAESTKTAPETATKPVTETKQVVETVTTSTMPVPEPKPVPSPVPARSEITREDTLIRPRPGRDATDKQKRKYIKESDGAVTRRQGELGGKSVWHVFTYPYGPSDYLVVTGKKPVGAAEIKGTKSGYIARVRGKAPSKTTHIDMGAVDVILIPVGGNKVRVSFNADPKGLTQGDITISRRSTGISRRKMPRLTNKAGRLR